MKRKALNINPAWIIAPAIVVAWMLGLYYINDIYPFGDSTLLNYDLYHGNMPGIYQVYDAWHSGDLTRLIYSFNTAGGFASGSWLAIIQPRFIYSLFFSREFLPKAIDLFFVFEFGLIGFTASYSFSKLFPRLSASRNVLISVMYAFNGFSMMYLTNIDWLDIVLLYPLLMLFAIRVLDGKNKVPFFIVLSYIMAVHTYMAFFVVISLVIFGGLYIYLITEKEKRKFAVFNLGIGTGASLVASSYFIFGYARGILSSERMQIGSYVRDGVSGKHVSVSGFEGILKVSNEIDIVSVFMFLGTALAIASLIALWIRFKKHKESRKYTIFFTTVIILFVCQIVFKATMLYWHFGSYQYFPFRNGYMVAFFCCCILGYYFSYWGDLEGIKTGNNVVKFLTIIPAVLTGVVMASFLDVFITNAKNVFRVLTTSVEYQTGLMSYPYFGIAISLVVCFLMIKLISFKTLRNIFTFALVFFMIGINSFSIFYGGTLKDKGDIYKKELEAADMLLENDELSRACNIDGCLLENYPYIAGTYGVSGWNHTLPANHLKTFVDLGLSNQFTMLRDTGGTVFSRALLRFTETISASELDNMLYEKYDETESGIKYYSNKFILPAGICADEKITSICADDYKNIFEYQNAIYSSFGGDGELFEKVNYKSSTKTVELVDYYYNKEDKKTGEKQLFIKKQGVVTAKYVIEVKDEAVLYLHNADKNQSIGFAELKINGQLFHVYDGKIPDKKASFNTMFPAWSETAVLELGSFKNETVEVTIKFNEDYETDERAVMYLMDMNKMKNLCENQSGDYSVNKSEITLNVDNKNNEEIAFLPLSYDANWKCTVNGEVVEPICIIGNFMGISLDEGANSITLKYSAEDVCKMIAVCVISVLIGLSILFIERKIKFPKAIQTIAFAVFTLIFAGGMTVLYILPVGYNAVTALLSLFK